MFPCVEERCEHEALCEHVAILAQKDEKWFEHEALLALRFDMLGELEDKLALKEEKLCQHEATLALKDEKLGEREAMLASKEAQLCEFALAVEESKKELALAVETADAVLSEKAHALAVKEADFLWGLAGYSPVDSLGSDDDSVPMDAADGHEVRDHGTMVHVVLQAACRREAEATQERQAVEFAAVHGELLSGFCWDDIDEHGYSSDPWTNRFQLATAVERSIDRRGLR